MERLVETASKTLAQLTVFGDVLILVGVAMIMAKVVFGKKLGRFEDVWRLVTNQGLWLAWMVALLATMGSLFFSEGAGYDPCKLCWMQRIFMYPLSIILFLAALKKDKKIVPYVLTLSLIGLVIAVYHYYVQISGVEILKCSTVGYSASCSEHFFMRYGYVTIVTMSATAFGMISVAMGVVGMGGKK